MRRAVPRPSSHSRRRTSHTARFPTPIVDVSTQGTDHGTGNTPPVTGLAAVQAAAPFAVVAPDTLVGLPRQDVRLVGGKTVLVVYGQGLGAIVVVERAADAAGGPGALSALPSVSLDGVTAHELDTQLGTALEWTNGGVSYVLAGSVPPAAAEAAARALKCATRRRSPHAFSSNATAKSSPWTMST